MSKAAKKKATSAGKQTAPARRRGSAKGSIDLKNKIVTALREEFPKDTVDVTDGYMGNIHVLVVSRLFDGKSEYERQGILRDCLDRAGLTNAQTSKISLMLALSPGEIK
ncbi:MAG TPA: hypothetical protein PLU35_04095 [Phycisphaerales bacterium]|nr:hypothetical protein [Phycisphaerales bacterium]